MTVDVTANVNGITVLYFDLLILSCGDVRHWICKVLEIYEFIIFIFCWVIAVILKMVILLCDVNSNDVLKTRIRHFAPNIHLTAGNIYFTRNVCVSVVGCLVAFVKLLGGSDRNLTAVNLHKVALSVVAVSLTVLFLQTVKIQLRGSVSCHVDAAAGGT